MSRHAEQFDQWIRSRFVELNTTLEQLYFAQDARTATHLADPSLREALRDEGAEYVSALLAEGNTDEGFEAAFDLLGNVGLYMGACHRHGLDENEPALATAAGLAMHIGASLGLAPRFATSHLATHNLAVHGTYKRFTSLADEALFLEHNTRGILAYKRAAEALVQILPLGVSHPVARDLLTVAGDALTDVARTNQALFDDLDADAFFYSVRPYYKPYRVGRTVYRGANAGDFAGINEIDLLTGLCEASHPMYSQLLVDKFLFMLPTDQQRLRECMRQRSLLDRFLDELAVSSAPPLLDNARCFLHVCRAHGHTAKQHHDWLVERFISQPSAALDMQDLATVTASGPPLPVLLRGLETLRDMRLAAPRDDIPSRHAALARLARRVGESTDTAGKKVHSAGAGS
ncbi:MAG: monodechloroaminopyrrolnitrin synthase PrnB family protein [Pseudomonadota bacterium]